MMQRGRQAETIIEEYAKRWSSGSEKLAASVGRENYQLTIKMAEKKSQKNLERTYNIPLRKGVLKTPKYRRAKKSIYVLKKFIEQHMKPVEIKIGKYLNLELWKHGIKNFPHHVKVTCIKDEKGIVSVEIFGAPIEKKDAKKESKDGKEKQDEKKAEKKPEAKPESKETKEINDGKSPAQKEQKTKEETAKEVLKEEIKELQKEKPNVHHKPKDEGKVPTQKIKKKEFVGENKGN